MSVPLYYSFMYYLSFKEQKYCYDSFSTYLNPTTALLDISHENKYLNFYINRKNGINTKLGFPRRFILKNEKVYILDYNEDSTLAKIFVESQLEKGFFYFWVFSETLHDKPPTLNIINKNP